MLIRNTLIIVGFLTIFPVSAYAQCTKDTDCKGDRVCEGGSCVNPGGAAQQKPRKARASGKNEVLITVDANLQKGIEAVGGKLIVTNRALIFSSHAFNIQRGETRIPIKKIKKIEKFGLIPNGLRVRMKDGTKYEFRISNIDRVMNYIENNM